MEANDTLLQEGEKVALVERAGKKINFYINMNTSEMSVGSLEAV